MGSRHGRTTDSARPSPERAKQTQPWRARCRVSSSRRRNKVCHARAMRGRAVRPFALVANTPPNLRRLGQRRARGVRAASSFFARAHHKPPCADDGALVKRFRPRAHAGWDELDSHEHGAVGVDFSLSGWKLGMEEQNVRQSSARRVAELVRANKPSASKIPPRARALAVPRLACRCKCAQVPRVTCTTGNGWACAQLVHPFA